MKRKREQARQEKRKEKAAKRHDRTSQNRDQTPSAANGGDIDPDIAHIVPGPQPKPWDDEDDDVVVLP